MKLYFEFLDTIYPSYENGFFAMWGGVYMFSLVIQGILYVARAQNRRSMARYFLGMKFEDEIDRQIRERTPYKMTIIWHNVIQNVMSHLNAIVGIIWVLMYVGPWKAWVFVFVLWFFAGLTVPMGSHRLYSHKAFVPSRAYEIVLMLFNCLLYQNSLTHWARDHRVHHKFVDTDADPINAKGGKFFPQIGWLFVEKHPDVLRKSKTVDISDLLNNPVLAFQRRHYFSLVLICHYIFPTLFMCILLDRPFWPSLFCAVELPWCYTMMVVGLAASWAHSDTGSRLYNKRTTPSDGGLIRNIFIFGEGFHNYHHAFPYDYRSNKKISCPAGVLIKCFSYFGITWALREASPQLIQKTRLRSKDVPDSQDY